MFINAVSFISCAPWDVLDLNPNKAKLVSVFLAGAFFVCVVFCPTELLGKFRILRKIQFLAKRL